MSRTVVPSLGSAGDEDVDRVPLGLEDRSRDVSEILAIHLQGQRDVAAHDEPIGVLDHDEAPVSARPTCELESDPGEGERRHRAWADERETSLEGRSA